MAGHYFYDPRPFYGHNGHTGLMPLDELFYGRYDPVVPYWMDQRMMFDDTLYKQQLASRRGGPEVMQQQYLPQRGENNFMPYKRPELVRDDMYMDMYTRRSPYNFNYSNYGRDGFAVSAPMQFQGQQSQDDNWVHAMSAPPAPYGHGQGYRGLPEPPPGGLLTRALTNGSGIDPYYQNNQGGEQYRQMDMPANTHMMSNQNNMASNMGSNMASRMGSNMASNMGGNMASKMGSNMASNMGGNMASNMGGNMSNRDTHGNSHGNNQGNSQGNNHGNSQGNNHGNSHGNSHGNNQSNGHSNSHSNSHGNNHGNNQSNVHSNSHSNSHGNNHGNSQGSLGTKQVGFSGTQTGSFGKPAGKSSSMQTSSKQTTISNTKRYDSSSSSDSDDDDDRHGHNNGSSKWGSGVKSMHGHGGKVSSGHGSSHGYESNSRGGKNSSHSHSHSHSTRSKKSSSHGHGGQSKISRLLGFGGDSSSSEDESYGHGGGKGMSRGSSKGSANQHGSHVASFQPNYGAQPKQMQMSSNSKSVELKVPICCDNCERKVQSCLERMHGVESVLCDQWNKKVIVYGNLKAEDVLKRVRRVKKTSELWSLAKQQQQQLVRVY